MQINSILQGVILCFLLLIASYTDIKKREIPDTVCRLIAFTGLLNFRFVNLIGLIVALPFFMAAISKENSIGGGDIKMTAALGIAFGFWNGIYGLILALMLLLVFYIVLKLIAKIRKKQVPKNLSMPLAPFLGIGFITIYFIT